jgi:hypothetical protein
VGRSRDSDDMENVGLPLRLSIGTPSLVGELGFAPKLTTKDSFGLRCHNPQTEGPGNCAEIAPGLL